MRDSIGKLPEIESKDDALREIRKIALNKRGHVLLSDEVEWLQLKLKAVGLLAFRGLRLFPLFLNEEEQKALFLKTEEIVGELSFVEKVRVYGRDKRDFGRIMVIEVVKDKDIFSCVCGRSSIGTNLQLEISIKDHCRQKGLVRYGTPPMEVVFVDSFKGG